MALQISLDKLDGVDEAHRALYIERDGKFHLDVAGLEDTAGLKSALEKERIRAREFEKKFGQLKDVDPEEYTRLKQEAEARAAKDAESKGQWETLKIQLVEKHQKDLDAANGTITAMKSTLENYLVDAAATAAIAEAKGIPALLLPHVKAAVKVVAEDGRYIVQVVDQGGNARIQDAQGTPMTISDLVAEMKKSEVFGRAFEGTGATGAGSRSSAGVSSDKSMSRTQFYSQSPQAQMAFVKGGGIITD